MVIILLFKMRLLNILISKFQDSFSLYQNNVLHVPIFYLKYFIRITFIIVHFLNFISLLPFDFHFVCIQIRFVPYSILIRLFKFLFHLTNEQLYHSPP